MIDGVKALGWELTGTHRTPSWLNIALPRVPSLSFLPFVTLETLGCCYMKTLDSLHQGTPNSHGWEYVLVVVGTYVLLCCLGAPRNEPAVQG